MMRRCVDEQMRRTHCDKCREVVHRVELKIALEISQIVYLRNPDRFGSDNDREYGQCPVGL